MSDEIGLVEGQTEYYRYVVDHGLYGNDPAPRLEIWTFVRKTPAGVWIESRYGERKWVGDNHRKKFAHRHRADAFESLIRRKTCQIAILEEQLKRAREDMKAINEAPRPVKS